MLIVTQIWQKLSSAEHKMMLIVKNYWQLFSHIFGETLLIFINIWRNPIYIIKIRNLILLLHDSLLGPSTKFTKLSQAPNDQLR